VRLVEVDAMVELLVRLHLAGLYGGDRAARAA